MVCSTCGGVAEKKCGRCKLVQYCSQEHQRDDWSTHKKFCGSFIIKESREDGKKYMEAAKDLEVGSLICIENPLFQISRVHSGYKEFQEQPRAQYVLCVVCGVNLFGFPQTRCSTCKWPICATPACQKHKIHAENECKLLASNGWAYSSFKLREDMRLVLILRASSIKNKKPWLWQEMIKLADSVDNGVESEINTQETTSLLDTMKKFGLLQGDAGNEMMVEEYRKLFRLINMKSIFTDYTKPGCTVFGDSGNQARVGDFLFANASYLKLSCVPNCNFYVEESPTFRLHLRAALPIKKGEILTMSHIYIDRFLGTVERQECMVERFGFRCECERCLDATELATFLSGITCLPCQKDMSPSDKLESPDSGFLLPFVQEDKMLKCNRCDRMVPYSDFEGKIGEFLKLVDVHGKCDVKKMKHFIETNKNTFLHPNHWLIVKATKDLHFVYRDVLLGVQITQEHIKKNKSTFEALLEESKHELDLDIKMSRGASTDSQAYTKCVLGPVLLDLTKVQIDTGVYRTSPQEVQRIADKLNQAAGYYKSSIEFYTKIMPCMPPKFVMAGAKRELAEVEDLIRQLSRCKPSYQVFSFN